MSEPSLLPPADLFLVRSAVGWLELGNVKEARAELDHVSAANRDHPDALEVWWKILSDEKQWPEALECGRKLSIGAPNRAISWIAQSYSLHELKRTREAYELLHSVVGRFPEHYVIPYNLACYQCRLGNKDEALKWLHRAVEVAGAKTIREMAIRDEDLQPLRKEVARLV